MVLVRKAGKYPSEGLLCQRRRKGGAVLQTFGGLTLMHTRVDCIAYL